MTDKLKTPLEEYVLWRFPTQENPKNEEEQVWRRKWFMDGAEWQKTHGEGLRWVRVDDRLPESMGDYHTNEGVNRFYKGCLMGNGFEGNPTHWLDESAPTNSENDVVPKEQLDKEMIEFAEWCSERFERDVYNECWIKTGDVEWGNFTTNQLLEKFRQSKQSKP